MLLLVVSPDDKSLEVGAEANYAEVIPGKFYFGNVLAARDSLLLRQLRISAVVNLISYRFATSMCFIS